MEAMKVWVWKHLPNDAHDTVQQFAATTRDMRGHEGWEPAILIPLDAARSLVEAVLDPCQWCDSPLASEGIHERGCQYPRHADEMNSALDRQRQEITAEIEAAHLEREMKLAADLDAAKEQRDLLADASRALQDKVRELTDRIRELEARKAVICDRCTGNGDDPWSDPAMRSACPDCHGTGAVIIDGGEAAIVDGDSGGSQK